MRAPLAFIAAFAASVLAAATPASASSSFDATYGIWLAGFPVGEADVSSSYDGRSYRIEVQARLVGLAGPALRRPRRGERDRPRQRRAGDALLLRGQFRLEPRQPHGAHGAVRRLGLRRRDPAAPAPRASQTACPRVARESVSHRRGVVDPVSAFMMPGRGRIPMTDPAQCDRTIPVFDGASRFDIVLSYASTRQLDKPGYSGPVLICNARFRAVSGHRAGREAVTFMEQNRDMAVWLAPSDASRTLLPLRVEVRTQIGMSVIEAQSVAIGAAPRQASN